jgi:hypothetical protein
MWSIVELEHQTADGLVIIAHWEASKEAGGKLAHIYGSVTLPAKDPSDPTFIPFDELTEEVVLNWVKAVLGEEQLAALEAVLDSQLQTLLNPPVVTGLPWGS